MNEDTIKQELIQLRDSHGKFEEESKIRLEKMFIDQSDILSRNKTTQTFLELAEEKLKHVEDQKEQYKQNIQECVQSIDEQRSLISEIETKLQVGEFCGEGEDWKCYFSSSRRIRKRNAWKWKMKNNDYKQNLRNIINEHKIFNGRLLLKVRE
jgi:hypothetical protein